MLIRELRAPQIHELAQRPVLKGGQLAVVQDLRRKVAARDLTLLLRRLGEGREALGEVSLLAFDPAKGSAGLVDLSAATVISFPDYYAA